MSQFSHRIPEPLMGNEMLAALEFATLAAAVASETFKSAPQNCERLTGLQTKKSSKEPLAPIRKKLRRQIIFFRCHRIKVFYFIIIIIFLHFNISIILSCVYVSSFLDFISILIDDQVDLGTKVHLKGTKCLFQLEIQSQRFCSLHSYTVLFIISWTISITWPLSVVWAPQCIL